MKRTSLKLRWLGAGLASLAMAGATVAYADPTAYSSAAFKAAYPGYANGLLWTFNSGPGADSFGASSGGDHSAFNLTWSSGAQSTVSGFAPGSISNGGVTGTGLLGSTANGGTAAWSWSRADNYYGSPWGDDRVYNAFTIDYNMPADTPLDTAGGIPKMDLWFQWGVTGPADNNGGTVPYLATIVADGNWHTLIIPVTTLDPTWNTDTQWPHRVSFGLNDPNYTGSVSVSAMIDNVGFLQIPEPATMALFGLGALALINAYRRKVS
jgi:PEP-CTERM motif